MNINPNAALDALVVGRSLGEDGGSLLKSDVHLFAYLACLLWLYRDNSLSEWGYSFVGTELGAPYSVAISDALEEMNRRNVLVRTPAGLVVSRAAVVRLRPFEEMAVNRSRLECLQAACSSVAALPRGMINGALSEEPELRRARVTPANRPLLEQAARARLFEQFRVLRGELGGRDADLRVPAVVWLSALNEVGKRAE